MALRKPSKPAAMPAKAPPQVEISKRAFEIYQERMKSKAKGDQLSDWLQAEKEVRSKYM